VDERLDAVDPALRGLAGQIAAEAGRRALARRGRAAHAVGIVLSGRLRVLDRPDLPPHALLSPGRSFRLLLRHSNARGFADDAVADGRGAALRLLDDGAPVDRPALDLILVTGRRFLVRDAAAFARWSAADAAERAVLLAARPSIGQALWELIRDPDSYAELHYYSQTTYRFVG